MTIVAGVPNSAKIEFLVGTHTAADTYNIALYVAAAGLHPTSSAVYSATNEVANGGGYTTGGKALTGYTSASMGPPDNLAYVTFANPSWTAASFTARGAVIYNSSKANRIVGILDFGSDYTATNGTFTVTLPAAGNTAIVRIT